MGGAHHRYQLTRYQLALPFRYQFTFCGLSAVYLWSICDLSVVYLWSICGLSVVYLLSICSRTSGLQPDEGFRDSFCRPRAKSV